VGIVCVDFETWGNFGRQTLFFPSSFPIDTKWRCDRWELGFARVLTTFALCDFLMSGPPLVGACSVWFVHFSTDS
jgi:hypothetical protein